MSVAPSSGESRRAEHASTAAEVGVPLDVLRNLGLSSSVRSLLDYAMDLKAKFDARGPLDTGALFFALLDLGSNSKREYYGPAVFARMVTREGQPLIGKIRETYFHEAAQVTGDGKPIASREVYEVFELATQLPRHDGIVAARHLIVALFVTPPQEEERSVPHFHDLLRGLQLDPERLAREFVESLALRGEDRERAAWHRLLEEDGMTPAAPRKSTGAGETSPAGPRFSGFQADVPSGRAADDCLNLDATVSAFANLLASPQLAGNLSLGVFGNWGSGKSFFMERLLAAVDELTKSARDAEGRVAASNTGEPESDAEPPPYWSNIAQIRFNAWHYADANLWASLMSHLLAELQRWDPSPPHQGRKNSPLQTALGQLEISAAAQAEAQKREAAAKVAVETAEKARDETQQKCALAAEAGAQVAQRSVWSFISKQLVPETTQLAADFERVGLDAADAAQPIERVYAELKELSTGGGQLRAVVVNLLRAPGGNRRLLEFAAWIGVPVAVLLLLLLTPLRDWLRESAAWFATTLAGLSVAIARIAGWIKEHSANALAALRPLTVARRRIEDALAVAETAKAAEVARKENELAEARAELAVANAEVSERNRELEKAAEAVTEAISGRAVSRFIERRLASGDYQKHLGLVALIRRDFEQLSELIRAHNAQRRSLHEERQSAVDALMKARPSLTPDDLEKLFANLGVNRIILYIDDLDRCPAERVVQVLEAIHLLLAFPIFVVVVGVDARWMHHALATQFPALLGRTKARPVSPLPPMPAPSSAAPGGTAALAVGADGPPPAATHANSNSNAPAVPGFPEWDTGLRDVTPADYLEKIFQIPFWVPPLDTPATKTMLARLTHDLRETSDAAAAATSGKNRKPGSTTRESNVGTGAKNVAGAGAASRKNERPGSAADAPKGADSSGANSNANANIDAARQVKGVDVPPVARRPGALRLSERELADMNELAPLIGRSPRATKRFVNSYRLLKASLTPRETAQLAAQGPLASRAPMFLLAIVTGLPELAPKFFSTMAWSTQIGKPALLLADLSRSHGLEIETVRRVEEFFASDEAREWQQIRHEMLAPWTSRVAQFAFEDLLPTWLHQAAVRESAS